MLYFGGIADDEKMLDILYLKIHQSRNSYPRKRLSDRSKNVILGRPYICKSMYQSRLHSTSRYRKAVASTSCSESLVQTVDGSLDAITRKEDILSVIDPARLGTSFGAGLHEHGDGAKSG